MSNQRAGKTHRAAANDGMADMRLRNFFRTCAKVCDDGSDAEFIFEQIVDHINRGGSINTDDPVVVRRIFGL